MIGISSIRRFLAVLLVGLSLSFAAAGVIPHDHGPNPANAHTCPICQVAQTAADSAPAPVTFDAPAAPLLPAEQPAELTPVLRNGVESQSPRGPPLLTSSR